MFGLFTAPTVRCCECATELREARYWLGRDGPFCAGCMGAVLSSASRCNGTADRAGRSEIAQDALQRVFERDETLAPLESGAVQIVGVGSGLHGNDHGASREQDQEKVEHERAD